MQSLMKKQDGFYFFTGIGFTAAFQRLILKVILHLPEAASKIEVCSVRLVCIIAAGEAGYEYR